MSTTNHLIIKNFITEKWIERIKIEIRKSINYKIHQGTIWTFGRTLRFDYDIMYQLINYCNDIPPILKRLCSHFDNKYDHIFIVYSTYYVKNHSKLYKPEFVIINLGPTSMKLEINDKEILLLEHECCIIESYTSCKIYSTDIKMSNFMILSKLNIGW
jgi:hypothetical protein